MKIDTLKTYKTAFQMLSGTLIIIVVLCFLCLGGLGYLLFNESQKGYQSVWLIDPITKQAYKADQVLTQNNPERIHEYENHVGMFYKNWYEFDQYTFDAGIERGLDLAGNCGKSMKLDYRTIDLRRKLVEKNMKSIVQVDSVKINMNKYPREGAAYAIQTFESPAGKISRRLYASFTITDLTGRSKMNPHGCLIDNFKIFDDSKIENQYE